MLLLSKLNFIGLFPKNPLRTQANVSVTNISNKNKDVFPEFHVMVLLKWNSGPPLLHRE
jgi:hypothetical protein